MRNKQTYVVKYDADEQKILDENFEEILNNLIVYNADFELLFINNLNIIQSSITTMVNRYISDGKKDNKPYCINIKRTSEFIKNLFKFLYTNTGLFKVMDPKICELDVIAPNSNYFTVEIPKKNIGKGEYYMLRRLGKDYIKGRISNELIFEYVLPAFYVFMFQYDLFDDERCNDIGNYKIGLH